MAARHKIEQLSTMCKRMALGEFFENYPSWNLETAKQAS
jgi:hypothetical protein